MDEKKPRYSRDEVSVVAVIGPPRAGTSTVARAIAKDFDMLLPDMNGDLGEQIAKAKKDGRKLRVVLDGLSLQELDRFESEVVRFMIVLYVDTPIKLAKERMRDGDHAGDIAVNHKRWDEKAQPKIKQLREAAEIVEIAGHYSLEEMLEMVQAKLESVIELEERGELYMD